MKPLLAIVASAPGRVSTMNVMPGFCRATISLALRKLISLPLPEANPMVVVMDLLGVHCAQAKVGIINKASNNFFINVPLYKYL
jgi:hypothetical protein